MSSPLVVLGALPTPIAEGRGTSIRPISAGSILERFDPHLVSSRSNTFETGGRAAWVLLSDLPEDPSEVFH